MRIPIAPIGKLGARGVVLFETIWLTVLLVWFSAGAHIALVKFWNRKLDRLQEERMRYDGQRESMAIHN